MGQVLVVAHLAVPDLEHVGIVPVAGSGIFFQPVLVEPNDRHAIVAVADIAGRAPQIASHRCSPSPDRLEAVLAQTVDDGPPGALQSVVHFRVGGLHLGGLIDLRGAAPVTFQIIDAPACVLPRVRVFVAVTALISRAGLRSR